MIWSDFQPIWQNSDSFRSSGHNTKFQVQIWIKTFRFRQSEKRKIHWKGKVDLQVFNRRRMQIFKRNFVLAFSVAINFLNLYNPLSSTPVTKWSNALPMNPTCMETRILDQLNWNHYWSMSLPFEQANNYFGILCFYFFYALPVGLGHWTGNLKKITVFTTLQPEEMCDNIDYSKQTFILEIFNNHRVSNTVEQYPSPHNKEATGGRWPARRPDYKAATSWFTCRVRPIKQAIPKKNSL